IDELAIFNRSLNASEISQYYNNSKNGIRNYFGDCVQSCPSFGSSTESNNSILARTSAFANVSIQSAAALSSFTFNWNGTSYTPYGTSLIGMWNLDNNSNVGDSATVAADVSGQGNNANIIAAQWGPGRYGSGLLFFGNTTGSRATVPDNNKTDIFNANITLSAWIKYTGQQENYASGTAYAGAIAGKGWLASDADGGYGLHTWNDSIYWQVRKDPVIVQVTSPATYRDGLWHNAVGVLSRGSSPNLLLYVDGALVNSTTNTSLDSLSLNSNFSFDIGVSEGSVGSYRFYFNGSIDEIRLYNRSFSAAEVKQLYMSDLKKINSTLWEFDTNQTGLAFGRYSYSASAQSVNGYTATTGTNYVTIGNISITSVSPANNSVVPQGNVTVNVSFLSQNPLYSFNWQFNGTSFTPYDSSLVAMYNLDNNSALGETPAATADVSAYGNNGSVNGASWTSSGAYGGALSFNGVNNYVDLGAGTSLKNFTSQITVAAWVKEYFKSTSREAPIVSRWGNSPSYILYLIDAVVSGTQKNQFAFDVWVNGSGYAATFDTGTGNRGSWHYVVGTYDGSIVSIYLDGQLKNTTAAGGNIGLSGDDTVLGNYGGPYVSDNATAFNGSIDEVRIYNRSLSASEVNSLYLSNLKKLNSSAWEFDYYLYNATQGTFWHDSTAYDVLGDPATSGNMTFSMDSFPPNITFTSPSPTQGQNVSANSALINTTIYEDWLANFTFNWNGTNFTYYDGSLMGMWNLDNDSAVGDSATVAADASGQGNNAYIVAAQWGAGKYGQGLVFLGNSTGSRATVPDNNKTDALSGNVTLAAWFKFSQQQEFYSGSDYYGAIAGKGWITTDSDGGYGLAVYNDRIIWQVRKDPTIGVAQSPLTYRDGLWHQAVGVFSRGSPNNVLLYIDGALVNATGNATLDSQSFNSNFSFDIGVSESVPGTRKFYFNGSIDEVRLYNRALSASEVAMLYASNLQKINSTSWAFVSNQTGLTNGNYTYYAYGSDTSGNSNSTLPVAFSVSGQPFSGSGATSCVNLTQPGNYTLVSDLSSSGTCIEILSDNVTLDCQNHSITGNGSNSSYGIYVAAANAAVSNCQISNFTDAVHMSGATAGNYSNDTFIASLNAHVYMDAVSYGNTLYGNNFTGDPGYYVYNLNGGNSLNGTVGGTPYGNIYQNVINGSVNVFSYNRTAALVPGLYVGDIGIGYPYNASNSLGMVYG
ncbi:MAG TPA: LamG domain-containing protein, partial [Candidatus Micrarchaeota archaeon]|nr:LamG domain-containing protein [Candidatus Micrarchaeota archaeon]